jgi:broad specificity phosphatase PhoE
MLILVRHGESTHNRDKIICGNFNAPVTEKGKQQARTSAQELIGIEIHHAFATPLDRTQETLAVFLEIIGQKPPIAIVPELIERDLGDLTGLPETNFSDEAWKRWYAWDGRPENGESYHDIHDRVIPWLTSVAIPLARNENVLVVSHNGVMKVCRRFLENRREDEVSSLNTPNSGARWYEFAADGSIQIGQAPTDSAQGE